MSRKRREGFLFISLIKLLILLHTFIFTSNVLCAIFNGSTDSKRDCKILSSETSGLWSGYSASPARKWLPFLQELTEEYKGRVVIKMIEVYQEQELTRVNGIRLIPTQIFFDAKNQEVYRHVGFMDKEADQEKYFEKMGVK